jgi:hypothetical protein
MRTASDNQRLSGLLRPAGESGPLVPFQCERSLNLQDEDARNTDLSAHDGVISLTEEPLGYQSRIRQEWS